MKNLAASVLARLVQRRAKTGEDFNYLAQNFSFEGAPLARAIAGTFTRRGTPFPPGLPVGLTPTFAQDPGKARGWLAFWRKTGLKTPPPPLEDAVQFLVEFLERPLGAAAKGQALRSIWKTDRWKTG